MSNVTWLADPSRGVRSPTMDEVNLDVSTPVGADYSTIRFSAEAMDVLAAQLQSVAGLPVVINAPPTVRYNITRDSKDRLLVHLLNYTEQVYNTINISGQVEHASVELFSPDRPLPNLDRRDRKSIRLSNVPRYVVVRLSV